jgi:hypothetical protein
MMGICCVGDENTATASVLTKRKNDPVRLRIKKTRCGRASVRIVVEKARIST